MATVVPTLPTDNLYKFVALFGLVILVVGVALPGERLRQSLAKIEEADKARQVAKIRLDRRNSQIRDVINHLKEKSAEQSKNEQLLKDAAAKLQIERDALVKQAEQPNAAKEIDAKAKGLLPEAQALHEKSRQLAEDVKKSSEDVQQNKARQDELSDDIAIEMVNVNAETQAIKDFDEQIVVCMVAALASVVIGFSMMGAGFKLWYKKVQVYQDAILRKQAGDIKPGHNE